MFVPGATGTIGCATVRALLAQGDGVVCRVRPRAPALPEGARVRLGEATDPASLARNGFRSERFDALISCLASRTGAARDTSAIDHRAHVDALAAASHAGGRHFVMLSAICVQKSRLAFQHAKLAFEAELRASGLIRSIVRPTAYFRSLSGQIARVRRGKPFLVFADGTLTACKPISDDDLADYFAGCLNDPPRHILIPPIGGPGDAITPQQQGKALFALPGTPARLRCVPIALLDTIVALTGAPGRFVPRPAAKAELSQIGCYYATGSMPVLNPATGRYDADATPAWGSDTLFDHHAKPIEASATGDRAEHAVFRSSLACEPRNGRRRATGRGKRIRTSGPCLPKAVLYRAELFPDRALRLSPPAAKGKTDAHTRGGPAHNAGPPIGLTIGWSYAARRRAKPIPARPRPSSAIAAGSGTDDVGGVWITGGGVLVTESVRLLR